ncbi:hypothetical protein [Plantactinospora veratri]
MLAGSRFGTEQGLVVEVDIWYTVKRRPAIGWTLSGLSLGRFWTGRDFGVYDVGHSLLSR